MDKAAELEKKLAALKSTYISQLDGRIGDLEAALAGISADGDFSISKDGLEQLAFHAHKLAGTAGTFGFSELGEKGAEIELRCENLVKSNAAPTPEEKSDLENLVSDCRQMAKA